MAHPKVVNRWATLTPYECGKCRDRLTEGELEQNRKKGRYGKELRCVYCEPKGA